MPISQDKKKLKDSSELRHLLQDCGLNTDTNKPLRCFVPWIGASMDGGKQCEVPASEMTRLNATGRSREQQQQQQQQQRFGAEHTTFLSAMLRHAPS